MGLFDNALQNAFPGGQIAKPIMIAVGALLLKKMLSHDTAPDQAQLKPQGNIGGGDLAGGLSDLMDKFRNGGLGSTIDSWIGAGQNAPVQPGQLGSALGQKTIGDLARQSGMSEQELLAQLSQILPGIVDQLTPHGRLPNSSEINGR